MRVPALRPALVALLLVGLAAPAAAIETDTYRFEAGGTIEAIRVQDMDGDGRRDLVILAQVRGEGGAIAQALLVLRTPQTPRAGSFYAQSDVSRIPLDHGPGAVAGAVAVGRFGPEGAARLRLLGAAGLTDLDDRGAVAAEGGRLAFPTLLARSPGRAIVFWDQGGAIDGSGADACFVPEAAGSGRMRVVRAGEAADVPLALEASNRGAANEEHAVVRHAYVPQLAPAELDGKPPRELVAWRDGALVAWPVAAADVPEGGAAPLWELPLPFVRRDLGRDEVYTPRLELADVDGDGITDLLVTLVTGRRDQIGSFKTRLLHYPGPFRDADTGRLVEPAVRIDTESVALHTRFVDLDGDGALDYVTSSIRGTKIDLLQRVLGREPTIWHVGFRFDRARGTFEQVPLFTVERPYSREEAISNRFGTSAFFGGDFDGDGRADLLDLGNMGGVEILGSTWEGGSGSDPVAFDRRLMGRVRTPDALTGDAIVEDLTGDGLADAVLWADDTLYVIVPRRPR